MLKPKLPMLAQISICQGCCCGAMHKGNPQVPAEWLKSEWKQRGLLKRVHLSISGCLGPCDLPNVIAITNSEGTQWLAKLNSQRHYQILTDWAEQSKEANTLLPLPKELQRHALDPYRKQSVIEFEK